MTPTTDDLQSLVLLVLVGSHVLLWLRVRAQGSARLFDATDAVLKLDSLSELGLLDDSPFGSANWQRCGEPSCPCVPPATQPPGSAP